ncbi:MAG: M6 family metalloprotease domain-containing protein [Prevotella sp.]|nr:M6 family metalloprotease domain-containing protein [Prevotella sp.]
MKKLLITAMAVLLSAASLWARPALKGTVTVKQPDGTTVSIRLQGDEYLHWNTTSDGYAVVKDQRGFYVYAEKQQGKLVATDMAAHDAGMRSAAELSYVATLQRGLMPDMSEQSQQMLTQNRAARAQARSQKKAGRYDYSNFKGLVLLVEYNDCEFRYDDYRDIMERMINEENYTGEERTNVSRYARLGISAATCTGSMRDFFRDNSMGVFNPTFDVVGPIKVNRSQYYAKGTTYARQLMIDACTAADDQVDFSEYDVDGDGLVDMVYFIFAGLPSYIQGNNSNLLWPHQSDMRAGYQSDWPRKDGVYLSRYACSTELLGYEEYNWSILEGIGTMCHEFSHVLGLPDFYDADYESSGGQSYDPGQWSVMANGADYDMGRTPCAYSLFERYALSFATPQVITEPGELELENLSTSNTGYRMNTPVNKEFFMLENRQNVKWDAKLPGHGMLIFRVDSTSENTWMMNAVNNNPKHNYYELVRAGGVKASTYSYDSSSDPFPGTDRITEVTNSTTPANLKTWAGRPSPFGFRNIKETSGKITFEAYDVNILTNIILPENIMLGVGTSMQLQPELVPEEVTAELTWSSDNEAVATVADNGLVTGVSAGTATITATAENGVSASCVVTVREVPVVSNIAAFCALADDDEAMLQLDAQVLYVKGNDIYLRDASGSIMLTSTGISVNRYDRLSGVIYGRMQHTNRMPQLVGVEGIDNSLGVVATAASAAEPVQLHASQLSEQYYSDMVTVKRVQLVSSGGVWVTSGDHRARLYNTLGITSPKISVPSDLTKRYDVTAIYGTRELNGEVIDELYLLESPKAVTYTAATAISLPETLRMEEGRTYQLSATTEPASADVILSWSSSDEHVVSVSSDGLLTAMSEGVATITVTDLESGLTANCQVTVGDRLTVADIAAFKALTEGAEANLTLTDAQVLFTKNKEAYVRDASGAILLKNMNLDATAGKLLNGTLYGAYGMSNLMPVMEPVPNFTTTSTITMSDGNEVTPTVMTMDELSASNLCDKVLIKAAQLERDGGIYAVGTNLKARLYNAFGLSGISVPTSFDGKFYDITAIFGTNVLSNGDVVYELKLLGPVEEVTNPDAITQLPEENTTGGILYFDLNGRRLNGEPARGIYMKLQEGRFVKVMK